MKISKHECHRQNETETLVAGGLEKYPFNTIQHRRFSSSGKKKGTCFLQHGFPRQNIGWEIFSYVQWMPSGLSRLLSVPFKQLWGDLTSWNQVVLFDSVWVRVACQKSPSEAASMKWKKSIAQVHMEGAQKYTKTWKDGSTWYHQHQHHQQQLQFYWFLLNHAFANKKGIAIQFHSFEEIYTSATTKNHL